MNNSGYRSLWDVEGNVPPYLEVEHSLSASRSDLPFHFQTPSSTCSYLYKNPNTTCPGEPYDTNYPFERKVTIKNPITLLRPPVLPNRSYQVFRRGHGYSALSNYNSIP